MAGPSLDFAISTTDKVNVGSGATLDNINAGGMVAWVYLDGASHYEFWHKALFPDAVVWINGSGTEFTFDLSRAGTNLNTTSDWTNFTAYGLSKWLCIAVRWDTAGADGDQDLYVGDLDSALAEPSSYSTQVVGTSTVRDDSAADVILGNHPSGNNAIDGKIHSFQMLDAYPTPGELESIARKMRPTADTVGLWFPGYGDGTTTPDWSGNGNTGTITGATQVDEAASLGAPFGWDHEQAKEFNPGSPAVVPGGAATGGPSLDFPTFNGSERIAIPYNVAMADLATRTVLIIGEYDSGGGEIWGYDAGEGGVTKRLFQPTGVNQIRVSSGRVTTNLHYLTDNNHLAAGPMVIAAWTDYGSTPSCAIYTSQDFAVAMTEATYATSDDGAGAAPTDSSGEDWYIGNKNSFASASDGRYYVVAMWNRVLTLAELISQQFHPRPTEGCVHFAYCGYNGVGTVIDWSGNNNHGTITGSITAAGEGHYQAAAPFGWDHGQAMEYYPGALHPLGVTGGMAQLVGGING